MKKNLVAFELLPCYSIPLYSFTAKKVLYFKSYTINFIQIFTEYNIIIFPMKRGNFFYIHLFKCIFYPSCRGLGHMLGSSRNSNRSSSDHPSLFFIPSRCVRAYGTMHGTSRRAIDSANLQTIIIKIKNSILIIL